MNTKKNGRAADTGATNTNNENAARKCVLCGALLGEREGCNPWPLADHGDCCHACDHLVIQARMREESGVAK